MHLRRSLAYFLVGLADAIYPGELGTLSNPVLDAYLRRRRDDVGDTTRGGW